MSEQKTPITDKKVRITETIKSLEPGEYTIFRTAETKSVTIRSAVSRINKEKPGYWKFTATEKGLKNKIKVERTF